MSEEATRIIGVDYSGAVEDKKTWFTEGELVGNTLHIEKCQPITRKNLTQKLIQLNQPAVVAMDFPFAIPKTFAKCWRPSTTDISDIWESAARVPDLDCFSRRCESWSEKFGKNPMRVSDKLFPGSGVLSALCRAPRNLVPMTFYGMRMLYQLNQAENQFWIPLQINQEDYCANHRILLEIMPGAVLQSLKLNRPYKSADSPEKVLVRRQNRQFILDGLPARSGIWLLGIRAFRSYALNFDDCLDSLVAAVAGSMWHRSPSSFQYPNETQMRHAKIEGWIFTPPPLPK